MGIGAAPKLSATRVVALCVALTLVCVSARAVGPTGWRATYRRASAEGLRATEIERFTLALGPVVETPTRADVGDAQWLVLRAAKVNGERFAVWLLADAYPDRTIEQSAPHTLRYLVQEGDDAPREFLHRLTGAPVLPSLGAWRYLWPRSEPDDFPEGVAPASVEWLGHPYVLEGTDKDAVFETPPASRRIELLPDTLIGTPSNKRTSDSTRRYDGSDYELTRLTRQDYAEMIHAGMNCFHVDAEQAEWLKDEPVFQWGVGAGSVLYPECLYRSSYLGPTVDIDEPAVGTRDYVMRPLLAKDPALRRAFTPQLMLDAFKAHYHEAVVAGAPVAFMEGLRRRPDVNLGAMNLIQRNLYSWETMIASAAWQMTSEPDAGPRAIVFEPPGRIGTHRTLPEMNMAYGCQLRPDNPASLEDVAIGFLRGAARASDKDWGMSVYGSVDRDDAPFWLTHAYDLGSKYFFFWDNYQSACVPYDECLALARHLKAHADSRPDRDLDRLRRGAEVAILLPPGYDLGHVRMGRGEMWGLPELNLERINAQGVSHRRVMGAFFTEIERCLRSGVAFDLMWDLDGLKLDGYREVARVREDGRVELIAGDQRTLLDGPRTPERPAGDPPGLAVDLSDGAGAPREFTARARLTEGSAPVYYTTGADRRGVYHNAMVLWELFGPDDEDYEWLQAPGANPKVTRESGASTLEIKFGVQRPGNYRLRAATSDLAGRSTVVWTDFHSAE